MKFVRLFDQHSDYETYINGSGKILPNISYCKDQNDLHFNNVIDYKTTPFWLGWKFIDVDENYQYIYEIDETAKNGYGNFFNAFNTFMNENKVDVAQNKYPNNIKVFTYNGQSGAADYYLSWNNTGGPTGVPGNIKAEFDGYTYIDFQADNYKSTFEQLDFPVINSDPGLGYLNFDITNYSSLVDSGFIYSDFLGYNDFGFIPSIEVDCVNEKYINMADYYYTDTYECLGDFTTLPLGLYSLNFNIKIDGRLRDTFTYKIFTEKI